MKVGAGFFLRFNLTDDKCGGKIVFMEPISGTLQTEIAKRYGITRQAVNWYAHRDNWRIVARIGQTFVYDTSDVERTMKSRGNKRGTHSVKR